MLYGENMGPTDCSLQSQRQLNLLSGAKWITVNPGIQSLKNLGILENSPELSFRTFMDLVRIFLFIIVKSNSHY